MASPNGMISIRPFARVFLVGKHSAYCKKFAKAPQPQVFNKWYSSASAGTEVAPKPPITMERLTGDLKGIALIRMNRPETKNAISKQMIEQFRMALTKLRYDDDTRVVVIKSDVSGAFCAGADLKERREMPAEDVPAFVDNIRALVNEIADMPVPVIAAIDGYALGGGLELALACDIRVASASSKMGLTETKLAIIPGAGGTQRLTRAVGLSLAKELIFTGRILSGKEAANIGLVSHSVDEQSETNAFSKAIEIAKEIVPRGPIAIKIAKVAIDRGADVDLPNALFIEKRCYAEVVNTKDRLEGLKAFAEKRAPVYKGE